MQDLLEMTHTNNEFFVSSLFFFLSEANIFSCDFLMSHQKGLFTKSQLILGGGKITFHFDTLLLIVFWSQVSNE